MGSIIALSGVVIIALPMPSIITNFEKVNIEVKKQYQAEDNKVEDIIFQRNKPVSIEDKLVNDTKKLNRRPSKKYFRKEEKMHLEKIAPMLNNAVNQWKAVAGVSTTNSSQQGSARLLSEQ